MSNVCVTISVQPHFIPITLSRSPGRTHVNAIYYSDLALPLYRLCCAYTVWLMIHGMNSRNYSSVFYSVNWMKLFHGCTINKTRKGAELLCRRNKFSMQFPFINIYKARLMSIKWLNLKSRSATSLRGWLCLSPSHNYW